MLADRVCDGQWTLRAARIPPGWGWDRLGWWSDGVLPAACDGKSLSYIGVPSGYIYAGIGAPANQPLAQGAADAIRDKISDLSRFGVLTGENFAWANLYTSNTQFIDLVEDARRKNLLSAWLDPDP